MKTALTRSAIKQQVNEFFSKENITPEQTRKIKRIAMKYNIRLGAYKKRFCKNCLSDLRTARSRINNGYKQVVCPVCRAVHRWKMSKKSS